MTPRNPAVRKRGSPSRGPDPSPRKLLSVRSALVLGFAVLAALGGAGLLYAAHLPVALVVFGAVGVAGGALKLFDSMIELKAPWSSIRHEVPDDSLLEGPHASPLPGRSHTASLPLRALVTRLSRSRPTCEL